MRKLLNLKFEFSVFVILFLSLFLLHNNLGSDYYWHLKAGELLTKTGALISGDPFSFSAPGKDWVMHEWLFEYLLYNLHSAFGAYGVKIVTAGLATLSIYIAYQTAVSFSRAKNISLILASVTFMMFFPFEVPRPQLITYVFLALYLHILIGYKYRLYSVNLYILPCIMILWVNMHGGYVVGIALLMLFIVSEIFERYFMVRTEASVRVPMRPLVQITALCIIASLINPYTYHHWLYPFQVMTMSANRDIVEWLSPDFHHPLYKLFIIYVFGYLFIRGITNIRTSMIDVVLPLSFIFMGFISRRHIPVALLMLLPFYAHLLSSMGSLFQTPRWISLFVSSMPSALIRKANDGASACYVCNWLLLVVFVAGTIYVHRETDDRIFLYEKSSVPFDAVEFIEKVGLKGNVFNSYGYGGYLVYKLYPHSKVFIDGRMDLYGDKINAEKNVILNAWRGWREIMDSYPIDYILIDNYEPINRSLIKSDQFKLIYRDVRDSIYVKNVEKHNVLINTFSNANLYRLADW